MKKTASKSSSSSKSKAELTFLAPSSGSSSLLQTHQQRYTHTGEDDDDDYEGDDTQDTRGEEEEDQDELPLQCGLFRDMFLHNTPQLHHPLVAVQDEGDTIRGYGLNSALYYDTHDQFTASRPANKHTTDQYDQYGEEGEGEYEDDENEDHAALVVDDNAPEMSAQFYEQVDVFLKRPPPSLGGSESATATTRTKKKKTLSATSNAPEKTQSTVKKERAAIAGGERGRDRDAAALPPIAPTVSGRQGFSHNAFPPNHALTEEQFLALHDEKERENPRRPPIAPCAATVRESNAEREKEKKPLKRKKVGSQLPQREKDINHGLLREAFAYTDQLLRDAVAEEQAQRMADEAQQQRQRENKTHPRSAPADLERDLYSSEKDKEKDARTVGSGGTNTNKKKSTGGINAVRSLKKQGSSSNNNNSTAANPGAVKPPKGSFTVSGETNEADLRRNALNFDELVNNFQNGTTLDKLRRELAESQRSLAQSESAIRELSGQYVQPKHTLYR